jgi:hypothetical protein
MELNYEGNADITTVHQDIREAGKWSGDRWTQPVIGALAEGLRDHRRRGLGATPGQLVDRFVESAKA